MRWIDFKLTYTNCQVGTREISTYCYKWHVDFCISCNIVNIEMGHCARIPHTLACKSSTVVIEAPFA